MGVRADRSLSWLWLVVAYLSLAIGLVGVFLPLLPTTPFVLLAALCAARGSPRLHRWLLRHRLFGPMIRDWEADGAVSRRAKTVASSAMVVAVAIMLWVAPLVLALLAAAVIGSVAIWLWRRPEPRC